MRVRGARLMDRHACVDWSCEHTARELASGNPEPRYWIDVFVICQWKGALQRADMPQGLNNTDHGFRRVIASTGKVVPHATLRAGQVLGRHGRREMPAVSPRFLLEPQRIASLRLLPGRLHGARRRADKM